MPQWDFLDFLAENGRRYPTFHLHDADRGAVALLEGGGASTGVRAKTPERAIEIRAELVVGADGRHSTFRALAGLTVDDLGAPMDVLWMRMPRRRGEPTQRFGNIATGHMLVMIDRGDYWQCAYVIRKGSFDELKARGIEALSQRDSWSSFPRCATALRSSTTGRRRQAARRLRRPARALAPAGPALHRRRRPRDVADRRHRNQSCNPRCGRRREHSRRFAGIGHDAERKRNCVAFKNAEPSPRR